MSSGDESDPNDVVSERETQFVPRSDDDEVLWEVQEITAERGRVYKVKWVGMDPATGKPWAQSWVAKHDCTDKLVAEWKTKKKRLGVGKTRRGGRRSTTSRTSSSSKQAGSSVSKKKTRLSLSEATSSRLDSVEQEPSPPPPPPKKSLSAAKRKRLSEPATPIPAATSGADVQDDERVESSRPQKKQRIALEALLAPPLSSDEEGEMLPVPGTHAKVALQNKVPPLGCNGAPEDDSDEDDSSPPKVKGKSVQRSDAHSRGSVTSKASDAREERSKLPRPKMTPEVVLRRKGRITSADNLSQDEEHGSSTPKKKSTSKRKSTSEQGDRLSEKEVESAVTPIKVGPPRGVKRREILKKSGSLSKPGPSRPKPQEDEPDDEHVHTEASKGQPVLIQQDAVDSRTSTTPAPQLSIPQVSPSARPRSADLSPGARVRLELFDRMMVETLQPDAAPSPADVPERPTDDASFNYNDDHNTYDTFDPPRLISPPPSTSKPKHSKPGTPNGLVVPETESSGHSQSQTDPSLKHPPQLLQARDKSPRKPMDLSLPTIAVVAASATPSSVSPRDLFPPPKRAPFSPHISSKRRTFKPVPQISPNTFRSTINARAHVPDSEAPPSSIESFASPKRVDKGKQRAVEYDQLQSSLSEADGDGERQKMITQSRATDSELKRRGKELYEQALLRREVEQQKKKKAKQLKAIGDIVNGATSPTSKGKVVEGFLPCAEAADFSGGANSTTLDTVEHSEGMQVIEEDPAYLRIALREEEEESTQEAMGVYSPPPVKDSEVIDGGDLPIPPPRSPESSPPDEQMEDADHIEQPSVDLQLVSVVVQASQEQQHDDTDVEPMPTDQPTSSPPRPIPDNLTDSPKRRLGEALSLLNVKSEEIQRLERELADERKNVQNLKTELAEVQQSSEPTGPVLAALEAERAQWLQERSKWESDVSAWEAQRKAWDDEKASLSARLAELSDAAVRAEETNAQLSQLEAERDAWTKERDGMLNEMTQRSEELTELTNVRGEHDRDRVQWESEKASRAEEKARWETERAALEEKQETLSRSVDELTARVESATAAKVSAEKDKEFFREQYAQASGFVSSVQEENLQLEKRVKIAEGQAQEGVAGIKAMFEGRAEALQADIDRWKGLTELLQEKDRRTNDEIRLRAARVPELIELCDRLKTENKSLEAEVRKLGHVQQRSAVQRHKLYGEIYVLKKERASLRLKFTQLAKLADSSTQETSQPVPAPPIFQDPEDMDPNDMVIVPDPASQSSYVSTDEPGWFPCMWRPQWRDQCQHIFDTKEDLERHLQEHFRDLSTQ